MSQQAFEAALGRLICDGGFRSRFYSEPEGTLTQVGLVLSAVELASLHKIDSRACESLEKQIDDRVRRALLSAPPQVMKPAGKGKTAAV
jgi:hypothetical protein